MTTILRMANRGSVQEMPTLSYRFGATAALKFAPVPRLDLPLLEVDTAELEAAMTEIADRITVDPMQCGGRPCVRGMRIRVVDVLDLLAAGLSPQQVVEDLPDLEIDDIQACLRFASRRLDHPILAA
jgi:uncharacterized protein (DUF433 family)